MPCFIYVYSSILKHFIEVGIEKVSLISGSTLQSARLFIFKCTPIANYMV